MASSIDYLISAQNESGGWGYYPGQQSVVESTAAVLLALKGYPNAKNSLKTGLSWLLDNQHNDGGWGHNELDTESGWHTSWALLALKNLIPGDKSINKAIEWLTSVGNNQITHEDFSSNNLPQNSNAGALIWPWLPGQACWIEPTALAVFALEGIAHSQVSAKRIQAALDYFNNNRTPMGGWDIGNAGPYETVVEPDAYRTALVLLTLARVKPDEIHPIDLTALQYDIHENPCILSSSSGLVAIEALGGSDREIRSDILENQLDNGSWGDNPFFTAWAVLALRGNF